MKTDFEKRIMIKARRLQRKMSFRKEMWKELSGMTEQQTKEYIEKQAIEVGKNAERQLEEINRKIDDEIRKRQEV